MLGIFPTGNPAGPLPLLSAPKPVVFLSIPEGIPVSKFEKGYQFRVLKNWRARLCWGPGARTERAGSIGRAAPLATGIKACFRPRRRGVSSPPHPRRNQRLMIPIPPLAGPRALEALGPYDALFFKELKCYEN